MAQSAVALLVGGLDGFGLAPYADTTGLVGVGRRGLALGNCQGQVCEGRLAVQWDWQQALLLRFDPPSGEGLANGPAPRWMWLVRGPDAELWDDLRRAVHPQTKLENLENAMIELKRFPAPAWVLGCALAWAVLVAAPVLAQGMRGLPDFTELVEQSAGRWSTSAPWRGSANRAVTKACRADECGVGASSGSLSVADAQRAAPAASTPEPTTPRRGRAAPRGVGFGLHR